MEILEPNGFLVIKNFISNNIASNVLSEMKYKLVLCSEEVNTTTTSYLNCTGRWVYPSKVTNSISERLNPLIKNNLENLIKKDLLQKESNIICKPPEPTDSVPFHQDISYSYKDPFHFSVYIALADTEYNSDSLLIIEKSHNWPIEPAVDFWYPYFIDSKDTETKFKSKTCKINVAAGDAIIINSKIWHGSTVNRTDKNGFAYVTRWNIMDLGFPYIPKPEVTKFGIWNCREVTESILANSLNQLFNYTINFKLNNHELITTWLDYLRSVDHLLNIDLLSAVNDLHNLLVLDKAFTLHNARDISGKVYRNLWFSLLNHLNQTAGIIDL